MTRIIEIIEGLWYLFSGSFVDDWVRELEAWW